MEARTLEQWRREREFFSNRIADLELQVEELSSELSSSRPSVDGVLREFYALGLKLFQVEPKEDLKELTPSADGLLHITPTIKGPGPDSDLINVLVGITFSSYAPPTDPEDVKKPKYLSGNFAPVTKETPPTTNITVVEGHIPEALNGMMLRNGPNPKYDPEAQYRWLDGDSMIHGIRFKNERATYVARYTQTSRYKQQDDYKRAQLIKFGDLVGPYGLFASFVGEFRKRLDLLDSTYGISTANTGLVYHGNRIMALEDFGQPHVIYVNPRTSDLQTLGINIYNGSLDHWLSPHPKIDPETGKMFTLGSLRKSPYCIYRVVDEDGVIRDPVPITVSGPTYMHELCITETYVIFQDLPSCYDLQNMMTSEGEWIYHYDDQKRPRYGILPRYATSENIEDDDKKNIKWLQFDNEEFFVYHNANAWEDKKGNDTIIVLYCFCMDAKRDKDNRPYIAPAMWQDFHENADFEITWPVLYKMTFNITNPDEPPTKEKISDIMSDWPKINPRFVGRKSRYVYSGEVNKDNKIISIIKYDLMKRHYPRKFEFGTDIYGSEVVFVPNPDPDYATPMEDDGYLITFVHHEYDEDSQEGESYVYVIDAKRMESVAKLLLPSRVPYGFHSIYVTEKELQDQIKPQQT